MRRHPIRLRGNAKGNMRGEPPSTGTERGSVGLVSDRRFGFSTPFAILAVVLGLSAFAGISFAGDVNLAWTPPQARPDTRSISERLPERMARLWTLEPGQHTPLQDWPPELTISQLPPTTVQACKAGSQTRPPRL